MTDNLLDFIYQAFLKICDTASKISDFLFTQISIAGFGDYYVWQLMTGAVLIAAITYLIIRKFTV